LAQPKPQTTQVPPKAPALLPPKEQTTPTRPNRPKPTPTRKEPTRTPRPKPVWPTGDEEVCTPGAYSCTKDLRGWQVCDPSGSILIVSFSSLANSILKTSVWG
jgi:hypothetical protein